MVAGLHSAGGQSLDGGVGEQTADAGLQAEHLHVRLVVGPGEAGRVASRVDVGGALLGTALPVRLHGLIDHVQSSAVGEDDLVLCGAPEVSRVAGGVVCLIFGGREARALSLSLGAGLALTFGQGKLDSDIYQVPVDVPYNYEHRDCFVQSFVLGPGDGATDGVSVGQDLVPRVGNSDIAGRLLGGLTDFDGGSLSSEGHLL